LEAGAAVDVAVGVVVAVGVAAPFAVVALVATMAPALVAPAPAALLVEEFCARTRGREYANAAAPIATVTATTLIRRKSFSVPVPGF
jgi:hypothetical protein